MTAYKAPPPAAGRSPAWQPDPFRRYTHRYWNGKKWTDQVARDGMSLVDPLGPYGTPLPPPNGDALSAAQWYPDPAGRHQHRYWNGKKWTAQVADYGVVSDNPPIVETF